MKCAICNEVIMVHWMREVGVETLLQAINTDHDYNPTKYAEPWPEYRCNCVGKPTIKYDDYENIKDSDLYCEYGSELLVEPYYEAYYSHSNNRSKTKRLADIAGSTNINDVKLNLAEWLFNYYVDKPGYVHYENKLYRSADIKQEGWEKETEALDYFGIHPVVDIDEPMDKYTFDNDYIYRVVDTSRES